MVGQVCVAAEGVSGYDRLTPRPGLVRSWFAFAVVTRGGLRELRREVVRDQVRVVALAVKAQSAVQNAVERGGVVRPQAIRMDDDDTHAVVPQLSQRGCVGRAQLAQVAVKGAA